LSSRRCVVRVSGGLRFGGAPFQCGARKNLPAPSYENVIATCFVCISNLVY